MIMAVIAGVVMFAAVIALLLLLRDRDLRLHRLEIDLATTRATTAQQVGEQTASIRREQIQLALKLAEQDQLREELLYVINGAGCLLWYGDVRARPGGYDWKIRVYNREILNDFLPLKLLPGMEWEDAWYLSRLPEDKARTGATSDEALQQGRHGYSQDYRCLRADGQIQWIHEDARIKRIAPDRWRIVGLCTDITDRKKHEEEVSLVITAAHCLLWHAEIRAVDGRLSWQVRVLSNEARDSFLPLQLKPGQNWEAAWHEAIPQEDRERTDPISEAAIRSGQRAYYFEYRCMGADGKLRWLHEDAQIIPVGKDLWHVVGVATDVTERKQREEELMHIFKAARCIIWHSVVELQEGDHLRWDLKFFNEEGIRDFCPVPVAAGQVWREAFYDAIPKEDRTRMDATAFRAITTLAPGYSQEFRCVGPGGIEQWLREDVKIEKLSDRKRYVVGVVTDISERKQAEEDLRRVVSGARCLLWHALVQEEGGAFVWRIKPTGEDKILDLVPDLRIEPGRTARDVFFEARPAEDQARMDRNSRAALRAGQRSYSQEFRVPCAGGGWKWILEDVFVESIGQGCWRVVGVCTDINARKRAEEEREKLIRELQEALAKVKLLSGLLPVCASCKKVRDDDGYWNQIDTYIRDHAGVEISHSICPDCARRLYPEYTDS